MTRSDLSPDDRGESLAAELALGLLEGEELAKAQARLGDPQFKAQVQGWHERLSQLARDLPEIPPASGVKAAIDAKLWPRKAMSRFRGWLIGLLTAAAVALAVLYLPALTPPVNAMEYASELINPAHGITVTAMIDTTHRKMRLSLVKGSPAPDRDMELWWIADGATPVSLGLVPRSGSVDMDMPAAMVPGPGIVLAMSDEPAGGSVTGQPTGEVLASAPLSKV